jgi:hypothetical protein
MVLLISPYPLSPYPLTCLPPYPPALPPAHSPIPHTSAPSKKTLEGNCSRSMVSHNILHVKIYISIPGYSILEIGTFPSPAISLHDKGTDIIAKVSRVSNFLYICTEVNILR